MNLKFGIVIGVCFLFLVLTNNLALALGPIPQ